MKVIKGGVIVDPEEGEKEGLCVVIEGGRVTGLVPPEEAPAGEGVEVIDAEGLHVLPGLVDLHVHLRDPGYEWKEDIQSGTAAAAAGGFTSVVCMANTDPVNDDPETTRYIVERAREVGKAKVYPVAAITKGLKGEELTNMGELLEAGAVAFSDDGKPVASALILSRAMEYSLMFGAPLILHEEEITLSKGGCLNEGKMSTRLGLPGIPASSEICAVARDIALAEYTGAKVHIAHVSTAGAVEIIKRARERGVAVTAETAPHYLTLTEEATEGFNTRAKMNPPLRTERDREALLQALAEGVIDCVATDHAPHEDLVKECEFDVAAFGIIGLQTALPLTLRALESAGKGVKELVKVMSYNPSKVIGIKGGKIEKGGPADITLVDLSREWVFTEDVNLSKSRNSPFLGWTLKGKVVLTMVDGKVTYREESRVR
ncbi:MAG: dihydroorotase [Deltaproteobacteria bacterium]|nr:MAG: dihydroorotase [Deltaproteobacteria bacterium]